MGKHTIWKHLNNSKYYIETLGFTDYSTETSAAYLESGLNEITSRKWLVELDPDLGGLYIYTSSKRPLSKGHWLSLIRLFEATPLYDHFRWYLLSDEIKIALDVIERKVRIKEKSKATRAPRCPREPPKKTEGVDSRI